jgi:hypothetical protein
MLILEHYFASELFAAVCETLAMYILTREYQIMQQYTDITKFWDMGSMTDNTFGIEQFWQLVHSTVLKKH